MKRIFSIFIVFLVAFLTSAFLLFNFSSTVISEPNCDSPGAGDIDYCLEKIQKEIDALKPAHEYNKKELSDLRIQITSLTARINALSKQLIKTESDIKDREEDLAYTQRIFEEKKRL